MKNIDLKFTQRLVLMVAVAIMVACSWLAPLESTANQHVDAGFKRALASFAIARGLNAAISVVQGTELAVQPLGVGLKLSVGQILRPLNDMVEQFAHLMLVASIAFGVEKILISVGAHWLISLLLTVVAISWAAFYLYRLSSPVWLTRILVVMLMTRFAIPVVVIGSDWVFQKFLADDYTKSHQVMEGTTKQLTNLVPTGTKDDGFWKKATEIYEELKSLPTSLNNLKRAAEQSTERIIKVMVVFVLQTLVLPILMLWALWGIAKGLFEVPPETARFMAPRKQANAA